LLQVFADFTAIFTTPIFVSPNTGRRVEGPVRREPRQAFNKRMANTVLLASRESNPGGFHGWAYGQQTGAPNLAWVVTQAVFDYDTSDCYADPITCHCRNLDIPEYCSVTPAGQLVFGVRGQRKRQDPGASPNMTVPEFTQMLSDEIFTGASVCDHVIADVAGANWDTEVAAGRSEEH